jgi:hypothetical protein
MTPRQFWLGLTKMVMFLAGGLLLAAFLISLIWTGKNEANSVVLNAVLFAVAVSILASGIRAILSIFDWFEARKAKKAAEHG